MQAMEKQFNVGVGLFLVMVVAMVLAGLHVIATSLAMAGLTLLGLGIIYYAFPTGLKRFITAKPVMYPLDILLSLSVPGVLGFTLTGVIAGVIMGIMITFLLKFEHMRLRQMFSWQQHRSW